jgi:transposase
MITGGQEADCTQAIALTQGFDITMLLADKGYDSNAILDHIETQGGVAIIPPKKNRIVQRDYDRDLYKERHKIECMFGFLKHYRRLFARFDKILTRFTAFLHFVSALQWIK